MAEKTQTEKLEREYTIPLRTQWIKVPRYKRANKAVRTIKEFLAKHMKVENRDLNKIKVDKLLNEMVWTRGIKHPPTKIKVKAVKENGIVRVESYELSENLKFKKLKAEKLNKQAEEISSKKKAVKDKLVEEASAQKAELEDKSNDEKKEESEKKIAAVEAGKASEKENAKKAKHETKAKTPVANVQQKKALQR